MNGGSREHPIKMVLVGAVRAALKRNSMIRPGETLIVGVSGGADSMCLLDVLCLLREPLQIKLIAAHLHHGLRGEEADQDFRFVEKQAQRYSIPFEGKVLSPAAYAGHSNLQARAREFRYAFFDETAHKWGAHKVVTAHNRDDQVETLLVQMFRGTGSLKGIPHVREDKYIRPLLDVSSTDIRRYLKERSIPYREDSSNFRMDYLRNRLRHRLVPLIKTEINPSFSDSLIRLACIQREESEGLEALALQAFRSVQTEGGEGALVLRRQSMESLPVALQRRVIRLSYQHLAGSTAGLSYAQVQRVCDILAGTSRKAHPEVPLAQGVRVFFDPEEVIFSRLNPWRWEFYEYRLVPGQALWVPEAGVRIEAGFRNLEGYPAGLESRADRLQVELDPGSEECSFLVRNFRPGDRFRPLGVGGEKKLKKQFIDLKVPKSRRYRVPLLEIDGQIAWVIGYGLDERFRITAISRACLRVKAELGVWSAL